MVEKIRRCRWCKLIITDNGEVARAHCASPQCDWCCACMRARHAVIDAAEQGGEIPPDQMT